MQQVEISKFGLCYRLDESSKGVWYLCALISVRWRISCPFVDWADDNVRVEIFSLEIFQVKFMIFFAVWFGSNFHGSRNDLEQQRVFRNVNRQRFQQNI